MANFKKLALSAFIAILSLNPGTLLASEGRYQAHWNGKSYLILDSDNGHMWVYHGDSILYNGRIDGDEFEPPKGSKIWKQNHGNWTRQQ